MPLDRLRECLVAPDVRVPCARAAASTGLALAVSCGYSGHAHFIHEFVRFSGVSSTTCEGFAVRQ